MKALGWIITFVISIITVVVLELNKNTLLGWGLFAIAFAGIVVISKKCMGAWNWWKRGLIVGAYMVVCAGIVLITWPPIRQVPAGGVSQRDRSGDSLGTMSHGDRSTDS